MPSGALNAGGVFATLSLDIAGFNASLNKARAQMASATSAMATEGNKVASSITGAGAGLAGLGGKVKSFLGEAEQQAQQLRSTLGMIGAVGGAALTALGISAIKQSASFEQTRTSFDVLLGDMEKSKGLMRDLNVFAAKTPFEFPDLANGAKRLLSFGVGLDKVLPTMQNLGDISLGDSQKMDSLIRMFGKVKSKGTADLEALNIAIDAGVPIISNLAKHFKVSEEAVFDMVSKGKVKLKDFEATLASMTAEGAMFHDGMLRQSTTLTGLFSTANDYMGMVIRNVVGLTMEGDVRAGSMFDKMRNGLANIISWLDQNSEKITTFFNNIVNAVSGFLQSEGFKSFVEGMKSFGEFVINNKDTILTFLQGVAIVLGGFLAYGAVAGILGAIVSPLGLIAVAAGLVAVAVKWVSDNWQEHTVLISILGSILTVTLLPALVALSWQMGVGLVKDIAGATMKLVSFVLANWSTVAAIATTTASVVAQIAVWLWHAAVSTASAIATGAMTAATWLLNVALIVLTSPITWVIVAIVALIAIGVLLYKNWDLIKEKAGQLGAWIAQKFGEIKEAVMQKVNELIDGATEWGSHMMQNLANGIKKGVQWVKDEVDKVKNWIKDKLGFSYNKYMPSEIWGAHFMQNFADGIASNKNLLESQLTGVIDMATMGFAGAGATSTVNQTINAQLSDGVDVNFLGEKMRFLMRANY